MTNIASQKDAPGPIIEDVNTILKWSGVESIEAYQKLDLESKRAVHEKWAEGFEKYLFEGKAPTAELQNLFQRFRSWLISVYKELSNLGVNLNDDVRNVFDRMLTTSTEIENQMLHYRPL